MRCSNIAEALNKLHEHLPPATRADAKAEASASVGDAVDEEADHPKGKLTFSFVCIDYARCVDAFQVLSHGTCQSRTCPAATASMHSRVSLSSQILVYGCETPTDDGSAHGARLHVRNMAPGCCAPRVPRP